MWTPENLTIISLTFVLAGLVKGVIGLGLPTVALALLTAGFGLVPAMGLLLAPSFVTNLWQGLTGGSFAEIMRRLWSFLAAVCLGAWIGVAVLAEVDARPLSALLGVLLCLYAGLSLSRPQVRPPGKNETWLSPLIGAATGVLTGMTGSFVVPGVLYLQALRLPRDTMIQAMGLAFTASTMALAVGLDRYNLITTEVAGVSALAVAPALLGMVVGRALRRRLSEALFRKVFFLALFILGLYIAAKALF